MTTATQSPKQTRIGRYNVVRLEDEDGDAYYSIQDADGYEVDTCEDRAEAIELAGDYEASAVEEEEAEATEALRAAVEGLVADADRETLERIKALLK